METEKSRCVITTLFNELSHKKGRAAKESKKIYPFVYVAGHTLSSTIVPTTSSRKGLLPQVVPELITLCGNRSISLALGPCAILITPTKIMTLSAAHTLIRLSRKNILFTIAVSSMMSKH